MPYHDNWVPNCFAMYVSLQGAIFSHTPCSRSNIPSYSAPLPQDLAQGLGKIALTPALVLQPWGQRLEEGNHLTAGSASSLWHKLQRSGTVNVSITASQKTGRRRFFTGFFPLSLQYSEWKRMGSCVQALVLFVCLVQAELLTPEFERHWFLSIDLTPVKEESHF